MNESPINRHNTYKLEQAAISRGRLYPVTAFYTSYSIVMLILAWRTPRFGLALVYFLAGLVIWTLVEYFSHRFVLHGHFRQSKKWYKKHYMYLANRFLDPLHFPHHDHPLDGLHINGVLKDLLPVFIVLAVPSFLFPLYTAPMMVAAIAQGYVAEEWIHHSIHFYNFKNRYFRHLKKYHLYHHTSRGMNVGYGITSGFWDVVFRSRFPETVRNLLFGGKRDPRLDGPRAGAAAEALDSAARRL
jgi:sterol desaturase/sphingolipid hydroxylase (fatty acid hydroxylase superfamily)